MPKIFKRHQVIQGYNFLLHFLESNEALQNVSREAIKHLNKITHLHDAGDPFLKSNSGRPGEARALELSLIAWEMGSNCSFCLIHSWSLSSNQSLCQHPSSQLLVQWEKSLTHQHESCFPL